MIRPEVFFGEFNKFMRYISQAVSPSVMHEHFSNFMVCEIMNRQYSELKNPIVVQSKVDSVERDYPITGFCYLPSYGLSPNCIRAVLGGDKEEEDLYGRIADYNSKMYFVVEEKGMSGQRRPFGPRLSIRGKDQWVFDAFVRQSFIETINFMVSITEMDLLPDQKSIPAGEVMYLKSKSDPIDAAVVVRYQFQINEKGVDTAIKHLSTGGTYNVNSGMLITADEYYRDVFSQRPKSSFVEIEPTEAEATFLKRFIDTMSSKETD